MATGSVSKQPVHVFLSFISEKVVEGFDKGESTRPRAKAAVCKAEIESLSADVSVRSSA